MWYIVKEKEKKRYLRECEDWKVKLWRGKCGSELMEKKDWWITFTFTGQKQNNTIWQWVSEWETRKKRESEWVCICVWRLALSFYTEIYNISSDKSLVGVKSDCTLIIQVSRFTNRKILVFQSFWHTDTIKYTLYSLYDHSHLAHWESKKFILFQIVRSTCSF